LGGSVVHNVLHAGIFLLDADMKLVLPIMMAALMVKTAVVMVNVVATSRTVII
jgi:hypothetical protein